MSTGVKTILFTSLRKLHFLSEPSQIMKILYRAHGRLKRRISLLPCQLPCHRPKNANQRLQNIPHVMASLVLCNGAVTKTPEREA